MVARPMRVLSSCITGLHALSKHALPYVSQAQCSPTHLHALGAQAFSTTASATAPGHEPGLLNASLVLLHSSAERCTDIETQIDSPSDGQATPAKPPEDHAGHQAAPPGASSLVTEPAAAPGHAAPAATHVPNAHGIPVPDWVLREAEAGTKPPPKLPTVHEGAVLSLAGTAPPRRHASFRAPHLVHPPVWPPSGGSSTPCHSTITQHEPLQ